MLNLNNYLTVKQLKEYLHIGNDKVAEFFLNNKKIVKIKIGNKYYFEIKSVIKYLSGKKHIDIYSDNIEYRLDNLPVYMTVNDFATSMNINKNTVYNYVSKNNFPATKLGASYYIWIDFVEKWFVKNQKVYV